MEEYKNNKHDENIEKNKYVKEENNTYNLNNDGTIVEKNKLYILPSKLNEEASTLCKLLTFLVGFIGTTIIGVIISFILLAIAQLTNMSSDLTNTLLQFIASFLVLGIIILIIGVTKPKGQDKTNILVHVFSGFKDKNTYIYGGLFLGAGLLVETVLSIFVTFIQKGIGYNELNANEAAVRELIKGSYAFINFLSIVIIAPLSEELTYRFGFLDLVGKKRRMLGAIIAALLFAFVHFQGLSIVTEYLSQALLPASDSVEQVAEASVNWKQMWIELLNEIIHFPIYFSFGFFLGLSYIITGNISTSIFAHACNNLISFISVLL